MRIAIFGAGSVGCYIGGCLAAGGAQVVLIGRPRLRDEVAASGLTVTNYKGGQRVAGTVDFPLDSAAVGECDLVLVCVKSVDSAAAAEALKPHLPLSALVVSFQNGIHNPEILAQGLGRPVLAGMIGFNVVAQGGGRFHQGTQGDLHIADAPGLARILPIFAKAELPLHLHTDMQPVLWAKLMMNLNNAINALANISLKAQLAQRDLRVCLALAQEELLALVTAAGLPRLTRLSPLPATWIPRVLRLPNPMFQAIAGNMLRIDPLARSSMSDDLDLGRKPEVDWINGEVVQLAESLGRDAPVNRRLRELVQDAAQVQIRPQWPADRLLADLKSVAR